MDIWFVVGCLLHLSVCLSISTLKAEPFDKNTRSGLSSFFEIALIVCFTYYIVPLFSNKDVTVEMKGGFSFEAAT